MLHSVVVVAMDPCDRLGGEENVDLDVAVHCSDSAMAELLPDHGGLSAAELAATGDTPCTRPRGFRSAVLRSWHGDKQVPRAFPNATGTGFRITRVTSRRVRCLLGVRGQLVVVEDQGLTHTSVRSGAAFVRHRALARLPRRLAGPRIGSAVPPSVTLGPLARIHLRGFERRRPGRRRRPPTPPPLPESGSRCRRRARTLPLGSAGACASRTSLGGRSRRFHANGPLACEGLRGIRGAAPQTARRALVRSGGRRVGGRAPRSPRAGGSRGPGRGPGHTGPTRPGDPLGVDAAPQRVAVLGELRGVPTETLVHEGVTYLFVNDDTKQEFESDPAASSGLWRLLRLPASPSARSSSATPTCGRSSTPSRWSGRGSGTAAHRPGDAIQGAPDAAPRAAASRTRACL